MLSSGVKNSESPRQSSSSKRKSTPVSLLQQKLQSLNSGSDRAARSRLSRISSVRIKQRSDENLDQNIEFDQTQQQLLASYMRVLEGQDRGATDGQDMFRRYFGQQGASRQPAYYLNEGDMLIGDFVLEFPNPDHVCQLTAAYEPITHRDIDKIFKDAFGMSNASSQLELMEWLALRQAFSKTYKQLNDDRDSSTVAPPKLNPKELFE